MPTLSSAELATLHNELQGSAYIGLTDIQRFNLMHAPTSITNTAPVAMIPKPFSYLDIKSLLSAASQGNLKSIGFTPRIVDDINTQNRPAVIAWADIMLDGGIVTQAEHDAINSLMNATIPDPSYSATIPGPSPKVRLFGGKSWTKPDGSIVDYIPLEDVAAAR